MWLCQERRKEPWRNHTGKAKNTLTSATKTVSIFRAIKEQIRRTSIVCSAIVLYMHWEINVVVISALRKAGLKTAPNAGFLTEEKILDMLQVNIASLRKLYGSSGKNKKQASSDTCLLYTSGAAATTGRMRPERASVQNGNNGMTAIPAPIITDIIWISVKLQNRRALTAPAL